jgi:hypothetical protein
MESLVAAVKEFARNNYTKDGWDIVVECWDDKDIVKAIAGARTVKGAIAKVRKEVSDVADYRADIQATAW